MAVEDCRRISGMDRRPHAALVLQGGDRRACHRLARAREPRTSGLAGAVSDRHLGRRADGDVLCALPELDAGGPPDDQWFAGPLFPAGAAATGLARPGIRPAVVTRI